jgi:hypothetical protein
MVARFLKIKELAPEQFAFSDDACKAINAFLGLMQEENPSGKRLQRVWMVRLIALAVALMIVPIVGVIAIVARQSSDRVQAAPVAVIEDDDNRYEKLTSLLRSNTFLCYNPSRLKISGVASTNGGADGMAL